MFIAYFYIIFKKYFIKAEIKALFIAFISKKLIILVPKL